MDRIDHAPYGSSDMAGATDLDAAREGAWQTWSFGPVRIVARTGVDVTSIVVAGSTVTCLAAFALVPVVGSWLPRTVGRGSRFLQRTIVGTWAVGTAASVWAGLGIGAVAVGGRCRLRGTGTFDARGAQWSPSVDWPHPIRSPRAHRIDLADGSVLPTDAPAAVLHALLGPRRGGKQ